MRVKVKGRIIILLSISICLIANSLKAQTITGDKIIDGEFYVNENIIITEGGKLEIKPGAILYFSLNKSIQVDGLLIAEGSPENPISFILDPNESNGVWLGIHFTNKAGLSVIQNCIFKNTGRLANTKYGALSFNTDKIPEISGCTFSDVQAGAIVIQNFGSVKSITINNISIESFSPFAIAISSGTVREDIILTENVIKDNSGSLNQAIYFSYVVSPELELIDNLFENINGELENSTGSGELVKVDQTNEIGNIKVYGDQVTECFNLSSGYLLNSISSVDFSNITVRDITSSQTFISINSSEANLNNSQFSNISAVGVNGGGAYSVDFTNSLPPGELIIDNTHFINCDSWGSNNIAGAISIAGKDISSVLIDNTSISLCQSIYGSGVNLSADSLGNFSFTNSQNIGGNKANSGGLLSIRVNGSIDQFSFNDNQVDREASDSIVANISNGGLLMLEAAYLNSFIFNNNTFGDISSKGYGGVIYLDCPGIQSVIAQGNTINSIQSEKSGGFMYLNHSDDTSIERIQIDANIIDEIQINNGHGGLLALNTNAGANYLQAKDNSFTTVICNGYGGLIYLGNRGYYSGIYIKTNTIEKTISTYGGGLLFSQGSTSGNKTSYSVVDVISNNTGETAIASKESGALIYLKGNFSTESSSFVVKSNISNSLFAEKSGGGIWFEGKTANKCTVELNQVRTITQSKTGDGGFLYLKGSSSDNEDDIVISRNNINSAIAKKSGGAFYLSLPFAKNIALSRNTIGSSHTDLFGGMFYLDGALHKALTLNGNNIGESKALSGGTGYIDCAIESVVVSDNTIVKISEGQLDGFLELEGNFGRISIVDNTFHLIKGNRVSGINIKGSISKKLDLSNNQITEVTGSTFGFIKIDNRGDLPLPELDIISNTIGKLSTGSSGFLFYEGHTDIEQLNIISSIFSDEIINTGDHACFYIQTDGDIGTLNYSNNTLELADKVINSQSAPTILQVISRELGSISFKKNQGHNIRNTDPIVSTLFSIMASDSIGTISIIEDEYMNFSCNQSGGIYSITTPKLDNFRFANNNYNSIQTIGKGAILYLSEIEINSLISENNNFENIFSSDNGGVVYLTGELNNILLNSETCINNRANFEGGSYYIENNKGESSLKLINITAKRTNSEINASQGGLGYFKGFSTLQLESINIENLEAKFDGGAIYLENNSKVITNAINGRSCKAIQGASIYLVDSDTVITTNSDFATNETSNGSFFLKHCSYVSLSKCSFIGNSSSSDNPFSEGSGIHMDAVNNYLLYKCDFLNDTTAGRGGGAYISESEGKIDKCNFTGNKAVEGGAIYFHSESTKGQILEKNTFLVNNGERKGGAIYTKNCVLQSKQNHYAYNTAQQGGAIYFFGKAANTKVYNSLFYANTSTENLGASCLQIKPNESNSKMRFYLINCTIDGWQNLAIKLENEIEAFKIMNSIIFGGDLYTQPINFDKNCLDISYSDVQYLPDEWLSSKYHNISVTPQFMNGYYILKNSCICVDAGHPDGNFDDMWFFNDGAASKKSSRNDLGASGGPKASYYSEFYERKDFPYNETLFQVIDTACHSLTFLIPFYQSAYEYTFTSNNSDTIVFRSDTFEVHFQRSGETTCTLTSTNIITGRIVSTFDLNITIPELLEPLNEIDICQPTGITNNTIIITESMIQNEFYIKPCIEFNQAEYSGMNVSWAIHPSDSYLKIISSGYNDAIIKLNGLEVIPQYFTISYKLSNTCGIDSTELIVFVKPEKSSASFNELENNNPFKIWHSDNQNLIIEHFSPIDNLYDIHLIDLNGRIVLQDVINNLPGQNTFEISTVSLQPGLYFISISNDKLRLSKKFIKY